jgi:hypothetical protein
MANPFALPGYRFRFRGRTASLAAIAACFRENPGVGLHPGQIARQTGMGVTTVIERLDATPELFIKLPKRDDLTRYRLTSTAAGRSEEEIDAMLAKLARSESLTLYAIVAIVVAVATLALVTAFPLATLVAN